jgi:hypothetical protein
MKFHSPILSTIAILSCNHSEGRHFLSLNHSSREYLHIRLFHDILRMHVLMLSTRLLASSRYFVTKGSFANATSVTSWNSAPIFMIACFARPLWHVRLRRFLQFKRLHADTLQMHYPECSSWHNVQIPEGTRNRQCKAEICAAKISYL